MKLLVQLNTLYDLMGVNMNGFEGTRTFGTKPKQVATIRYRKKRWRVVDEERCQQVRSVNFDSAVNFNVKQESINRADELTGKTWDELLSFLNTSRKDGSKVESINDLEGIQDDDEGFLDFLDKTPKWFQDEKILNVFRLNGCDNPKSDILSDGVTINSIQRLYEQGALILWLQYQGFALPEKTPSEKLASLKSSCYKHLDNMSGSKTKKKSKRSKTEPKPGLTTQQVGTFLCKQDDIKSLYNDAPVKARFVRRVHTIINEWCLDRKVTIVDEKYIIFPEIPIKALQQICFKHLDQIGKKGKEKDLGLTFREVGVYLCSREDIKPFYDKAPAKLRFAKTILSIIRVWCASRSVPFKDDYIDLSEGSMIPR